MHIKNPAGLVALCAASVAVTACGGSGTKPNGAAVASSSAAAVAAQRPANAATASNLDLGQSPAQRKHRGEQVTHGNAAGAQRSATTGQHSAAAARHSEAGVQPRITRSHGVQKSHATPVLSSDDTASPSIHQLNPCNLVPLQQAKAITHGAITTSVEAPLGPTCVYHVTHQKTDITLDIEQSSLARETRAMTKRVGLTISGHQAYCGRLGAPTLYVALPGNKLLHVLAPCSVARRFAARALSRVTA